MTPIVNNPSEPNNPTDPRYRTGEGRDPRVREGRPLGSTDQPRPMSGRAVTRSGDEKYPNLDPFTAMTENGMLAEMEDKLHGFADTLTHRGHVVTSEQPTAGQVETLAGPYLDAITNGIRARMLDHLQGLRWGKINEPGGEDDRDTRDHADRDARDSRVRTDNDRDQHLDPRGTANPDRDTRDREGDGRDPRNRGGRDDTRDRRGEVVSPLGVDQPRPAHGGVDVGGNPNHELGGERFPGQPMGPTPAYQTPPRPDSNDIDPQRVGERANDPQRDPQRVGENVNDPRRPGEKGDPRRWPETT